MSTVLAGLVNELSVQPRDLVLVLDDYHGTSYAVLYTVADGCALAGAAAVLPIARVT